MRHQPRRYPLAWRTSLAAALAALFVAGCAAPGSGGSGTVRIGLEAPLTGDLAVLGQGMLNGAKLAAQEINANGGLLGRQVEIVPIDDAADAETGVAAAQKAIDAGLDGVVGPYNSGVGVETLPLYIAAGLVPIRLTSDEATSGLGFTLQPMTPQIAPVAAKALVDWLGAKSVAIVLDSTQTYTRNAAAAVREQLQQSGVAVTAFEEIQPGAADYTQVVETVAAAEPDVIYAATYYPEGGLIAKAMASLGTAARCVADYGAYDTGFVQVAGAAAASRCAIVGVPAPDDFAGAAEHVAAYTSAFGESPGTWSPYTYDSVMLLAEVVRQAGGFDAAKLSAALGGVRDWPGWTGPVTLEAPSGNRQPATVVIVRTDADGALHVDPDWANAVGAPYAAGQ